MKQNIILLSVTLSHWLQSLRLPRPWLGLLILSIFQTTAWAQFDGLFTPPTQITAPPQQPVKIQIHSLAQQIRQGDQQVLAVVLDVKKPFHINTGEKLGGELDFLIPTQVQLLNLPPWLTVGELQFPEPHFIEVSYTTPPTQVPVLEGQVVVYLPLLTGSDAPLGMTDLTVAVTYQACDDRTCLPPKQVQLAVGIQITDQPTVVNESSRVWFEGFKLASFNPPASESLTFNLPGGSFDLAMGGVVSLILLLGIAAVGGALLNLTPCVLPVIPLKIMAMSRTAGNRKQCFLQGVYMSLGVVGFWLGLGSVMAAFTGLTAVNQLFQYPAFTLSVGIVICLLAIGMCGLFAIRLPNAVYQWTPGHDTAIGSISLGILTAILSTPCTAPFMGAAAAWAATQQPTLTIATFAAIGLGMASPYLLLSAFPQWAMRMPRVGPTSVLIKEVMGLCILAAGVYFVGVGISGLTTSPPDPPSLAHWWAVGLTLAGTGLWVTWRSIRLGGFKPAALAWAAAGLLLATGALWQASQWTDRGPITWQYFTAERWTQLQNDQQLVMMDFTAEWCLNCKVLEKQVLHDPKVVEALRQYNIVPMKVDLTAQHAEGAAMLKSTGRLTIPLLALYGSDGKIHFMADFYTTDQLVKAMASLR